MRAHPFKDWARFNMANFPIRDLGSANGSRLLALRRGDLRTQNEYAILKLIEKRRARQNVILELGFFLGTLGRRSGRVFLLYKGPLELPSDLGGVVYIDISKGIEAVSDQIRREIVAIR